MSGFIWIIDWRTVDSDYMLYKLDPSDGSEINKFSLPAGSSDIKGVQYLDGFVYITNWQTNDIHKIDATTGSVAQTYDVGSIEDPNTLNNLDQPTGIATDGSVFYVVDNNQNIWELTTDFTFLGYHDFFGDMANPKGMVFHNDILYIMSDQVFADLVVEIDVATWSYIRRRPPYWGDLGNPYGVMIAEDVLWTCGTNPSDGEVGYGKWEISDGSLIEWIYTPDSPSNAETQGMSWEAEAVESGAIPQLRVRQFQIGN